MLKKLLKRFKGLFQKAPIAPTNPELDFGKRADVNYGDKVGDITISRYHQLVKHTYYAPGEQYRVGEGIATVHTDKDSMYMALMRVEDRAFLKELTLTKRAVDIMMMTSEELAATKVNEFLAKQKASATLFRKVIGKFWNRGRTSHFVQLSAKYANPPPAPKQEGNSGLSLKVKEKVKQ